MINRRVFIGRTLGVGLTASTIKGTLATENTYGPDIIGPCSDEYHNPGILKSFRWELDEVNYIPDNWLSWPNNHVPPNVRYVEFPLLDKLWIKFIYKYECIMEEEWHVLKWQLTGIHSI